MSALVTQIDEKLRKIRWEKELARHGYERNHMSPELAEVLRREIRTALEADGKPFDINVARRVYDLAIGARDMCVAATGSVKEAIDQIKDTNGPMESLDASDTPESAVQASESFGARLLRELMAAVPVLMQPRGGSDDPKQLVHALAEARRNGMHDVAEELEVKLFGRVLSGPRPVTAEEVEVEEGSYEHGFADGRSGALPVSEEGPYHEGYLRGTTAKYLAKDAGAVDPAGVVEPGQRHAMLKSLADAMCFRGSGYDEIETALLAANKARCNPPKSDAEVRAIAQWAANGVAP